MTYDLGTEVGKQLRSDLSSLADQVLKVSVYYPWEYSWPLFQLLN